ncbi:hypothetical protein AZK53_17685 [Priestia megaterium]|uniref:hypothetical protein n=1 Tax=Priestia megaterium TaxID=1404 RepID=UPI0007CDF3D0|nr:hypothetical protein [Priestia megaterium]ANF47438.1 hypothetical protein AZK53_17685 [Priestia megaterium]
MRNNYPYQHSNYGDYQGAMYPQQGNCGYPQSKPCGQLPPQTMPAQYDPVKQNTFFTGQDVFVPVVHPSHTTNVYQKIINICTHSRIQNPLYIRKRISIFVLQAVLLELGLGANSQKSPFILTMKGFYYVKFMMLFSCR